MFADPPIPNWMKAVQRNAEVFPDDLPRKKDIDPLTEYRRQHHRGHPGESGFEIFERVFPPDVFSSAGRYDWESPMLRASVSTKPAHHVFRRPPNQRVCDLNTEPDQHFIDASVRNTIRRQRAAMGSTYLDTFLKPVPTAAEQVLRELERPDEGDPDDGDPHTVEEDIAELRRANSPIRPRAGTGPRGPTLREAAARGRLARASQLPYTSALDSLASAITRGRRRSICISRTAEVMATPMGAASRPATPAASPGSSPTGTRQATPPTVGEGMAPVLARPVATRPGASPPTFPPGEPQQAPRPDSSPSPPPAPGEQPGRMGDLSSRGPAPAPLPPGGVRSGSPIRPVQGPLVPQQMPPPAGPAEGGRDVPAGAEEEEGGEEEEDDEEDGEEEEEEADPLEVALRRRLRQGGARITILPTSLLRTGSPGGPDRESADEWAREGGGGLSTRPMDAPPPGLLEGPPAGLLLGPPGAVPVLGAEGAQAQLGRVFRPATVLAGPLIRSRQEAIDRWHIPRPEIPDPDAQKAREYPRPEPLNVPGMADEERLFFADGHKLRITDTREMQLGMRRLLGVVTALRALLDVGDKRLRFLKSLKAHGIKFRTPMVRPSPWPPQTPARWTAGPATGCPRASRAPLHAHPVIIAIIAITQHAAAAPGVCADLMTFGALTDYFACPLDDPEALVTFPDGVEGGRAGPGPMPITPYPLASPLASPGTSPAPTPVPSPVPSPTGLAAPPAAWDQAATGAPGAERPSLWNALDLPPTCPGSPGAPPPTASSRAARLRRDRPRAAVVYLCSPKRACERYKKAVDEAKSFGGFLDVDVAVQRSLQQRRLLANLNTPKGGPA
ncbi:hypothetical protein PAPYR_1786 [Paratrimastix pyriformis]|uniref:Uncharacterized protein n=1 Tax=Paratrimastix pyriformis TaxID=342808 RepID=A0ABQ8URC4_9EUKA|nr:hypothetical protein PAPYR_1786 [Paratrimastix pyriformis]